MLTKEWDDEMAKDLPDLHERIQSARIQQLEAELKRKNEVLREIENLSRNHNLSSQPQYMVFDEIAKRIKEALKC